MAAFPSVLDKAPDWTEGAGQPELGTGGTLESLNVCAAVSVDGAGVSPGKSITVSVGAALLYVVRGVMESGVSVGKNSSLVYFQSEF